MTPMAAVCRNEKSNYNIIRPALRRAHRHKPVVVFTLRVTVIVERCTNFFKTTFVLIEMPRPLQYVHCIYWALCNLYNCTYGARKFSDTTCQDDKRATSSVLRERCRDHGSVTPDENIRCVRVLACGHRHTGCRRSDRDTAYKILFHVFG
jgi:hypothetical protein